jgi:hypothetical protein
MVALRREREREREAERQRKRERERERERKRQRERNVRRTNEDAWRAASLRATRGSETKLINWQTVTMESVVLGYFKRILTNNVRQRIVLWRGVYLATGVDDDRR